MFDEKSEVDHMQEKVKLLQKLAPDTPTPLEIFDSDVHLVKQGPLTQVVGKKETQRMCFLFNRYIAVAESVTPTQYRILEVCTVICVNFVRKIFVLETIFLSTSSAYHIHVLAV